MRYRYIYKYKTGLTKVKTRLAIAFSILGLGAGGIVGSLAIFGAAHAAPVANYSLFGDASIVSGGESGNAAQIGNAGGTGFGGVDYTGTGAVTVADLTQLSTDYNFTQGSCGTGSPRFGATVTDGTNTGTIFFYIGPAPNYTGCPPNTWTQSGNLAAPSNLVDDSQLPGGKFYDPYSLAQANYGSYQITDLFIVADNSFTSSQTLLLDNTQINGTTFSYDQPSNTNDCKNGGWQSLTDGKNNPFKNQGQCVSYAQHTNGVGQDDIHAKAIR